MYIHDCCLIIAWSSDGRSTETSSEWLDDMGVTSWRQTVGGPGGTPMWLSSYVVATPAGRTNVSHAETQMAACLCILAAEIVILRGSALQFGTCHLFSLRHVEADM